MLVCVLWWRVMMQVKREREEREALGALPLYQRTIPWAILQQQQRYFLLNKRKKGGVWYFYGRSPWKEKELCCDYSNRYP